MVSSDLKVGGSGEWPTSPCKELTVSVWRSMSVAINLGTPTKPTRSRCTSTWWTAWEEGPIGRTTVPPTRETRCTPPVNSSRWSGPVFTRLILAARVSGSERPDRVRAVADFPLEIGRSSSHLQMNGRSTTTAHGRRPGSRVPFPAGNRRGPRSVGRGRCVTPVGHDQWMELSEIATEQLEAELVAHAAWESRGLARFLDLLVEYDRRQAWGSWGCVSVQHWLSWKCGLATVAASERLRVAKAVQELPLIKQAFWDGHLSYSKVRELTRVATPDTEQRWCEVAPHLTAGQLAKLVAAGRRATRREDARQITERSFRWATNDDGGITLTVQLPADIGAGIVAAVREASTIERGKPMSQSQADAFVELVLGRSEVTVEVIAHVSEDGHAILDNGNPISEELAECLACDGAVTTVIDTPDGPIERDRKKAPSKRQRNFLQRRHPTCQFPGCHHAGKFDAHHVIERSKGGRTKLNN
ncbi:MAG: DUF222 domain-containing protein, partial [Actinobacteria bacterium]|nr:DUF222 domain-containing protein [Actinomycetota bacterium]